MSASVNADDGSVSQLPRRLAVVVSTTGRARGISCLLGSLASQSLAPCQVVVVDQGPGREVLEVVEGMSRVLPVTRRTSDLGLSLGRNVGIRSLDPTCDIVAFLDDDCRLDPDALALIARRMDEGRWDGISGRLLSSGGQRLRFDAAPRVLDDRTVWTHAIEATMSLSKRALDSLGLFDEGLGIGAPTPWQSGEGTDLLLRGIRRGMRFCYFPDVVVHEETATASDQDRVTKARRYARGTGRVYARHYSVLRRSLVVARPLLGSALRRLQGRGPEARRLWQVFVGRLEGVTGRVWAVL